MNDLQPLQALLAQTERERDAALAAHRQAQRASDAARAQAEQLVSYRQEYEQRWQAQFAQGGQITLVQCYQGFIERLTQALESQTRAAQHAASQAAHAGSALRDNELRCASVRRLIERRVRDIHVDVERREQRTSDELAARAAWTRLASARHDSAA